MQDNWVMCSLNEVLREVVEYESTCEYKKYGEDGAMLHSSSLEPIITPMIILRSIQPVITVFYGLLTCAEYQYGQIGLF